MSASKRKGTSAESAVVLYLRESGWPYVERRACRGARDCGDVAGIVGLVIEVKNCTEQKLGTWVDEANRERDNDGAWAGVVWHKRRGRGKPGDWYVTMDGATFVRLLRSAQGLDEEHGDE